MEPHENSRFLPAYSEKKKRYATYLYSSMDISYSSLGADDKSVALGAREVTRLLVEAPVSRIKKVFSYIE